MIHTANRQNACLSATAISLCIAFMLAAAPAAAQPAQSPSCVATGGGNVVLVGPTRTHTTLAAGVAAAAAGDTICMDPGDYPDGTGVTINKSLRILGVGGRPVLRGVGTLSNQKGLIVSQADLEIVNLEFADAAVTPADGANGAGIRKERGSLTVLNSAFRDNQNGILTNDLQSVTPGATVQIEGSTFLNNGSGSGQTHAVYVVGAASGEFRDNYFESTNNGHDLKTLAIQNTIVANTFEDSNEPATQNPSFSIDIESGGDAVVQDNTFIQRSNATNFHIINYGGRAGGDHPGGSLDVSDNTVINERSNGTLLRNNSQNGVMATVTGNRLAGIAQSNVISGQADPPAAANNFGPFTAPVLQNDGLVALTTTAPDRAIREFTTTGLPQTTIEQPDGIAGNSGIASVGGSLFVANNEQGIADVGGIGDSTAPTGTSTFYFGGAGIEALTTDGTDLFAGAFEDSTILRFDLSGNLLDTILLSEEIGITGLSWFDGVFYAANFDDGGIYTFDMTGAALGAPLFLTDLGPDLLSGLAYDPGLDDQDASDDSLWVSTGFSGSGGQILRYDLAGQLLDGFGAADVQGLLSFGSALNAAVAMHAPGTLLLLAPAVLLLLGAGLRRARRS